MTLKPASRLFLLTVFTFSAFAAGITADAQQATPTGDSPVFATSTYTPSPSPNPFVTNTPSPWEGAENVIQIWVRLQGRPEPPHEQWQSRLSVELILVGATEPTITTELFTDENGRTFLTDVPHGEYQVVIKGSHALVVIETVTVSGGTYTIRTGTLQSGDANGDNRITLPDFSILASTFGKTEGQRGYDERADFNDDGRITLPDFSILASNFGQIGASE